MSRLALPALFRAVQKSFEEDGSATPNEFGWKAPTRQTKEIAGRVCWVPGDPQGEAGELGAPVKPGRVSGVVGLPIATLGEQVTIYYYGADVASPTDELLQYTAARELFDYWWSRLYHAAQTVGQGNRFSMTKLAWVIEKVERPHGRVLRGLLLIESAIRDENPTYAPVSAVADLATGLATNVEDLSVITTSDGTVHIEPETT